ncbi:MAG: 50S ribosomal protein L32, partial [Clostridia bacterium]|nr:50S ribosomal protein L32 [Clostridia bacterium]
MAVPKRKTSKARRDSRRANNSKAVALNLVECP